ncbi:hypothetical protein [Halegenticoccus tardaugens]|uniref:hypothetical protein n=1 Tax=Halegenticoccus tardaugens TaxID=2071624 RepID=UPI00100B1258|nr:hypothetical protein [Halegenticoccus tardaugens]
MRRTARTVAVVGPDGSGKTTQARLLTKRLRANGYDAQYVHALYYLTNPLPYDDRLRRRVGPRSTRTGRRSSYSPPYLARRFLFAWFGYWFALATVLIASVRVRDRIVVFDRYYQQFFYDVYGPVGLPLSRFLPQPWRMVYLEADLDTLRPRFDAVDRSIDERYHSAAIDRYDVCATDDWLRLPAELSVDRLHELIFEEIRYGIESEQSPTLAPTPVRDERFSDR